MRIDPLGALRQRLHVPKTMGRTLRALSVNFSLRVILALAVILAGAAIGVWGLVTMLRVKSMMQPQRMMAVGGIVLVMAAPAAWVDFLWLAYWD